MARLRTASSRVDAVTDRLRGEIFEGRYPPGTPLREMALAKALEVSQATVREALQRLEHAGLVTRTPNVGSMVTRLSPKDVRERVSLRALLEILAAQEAAPRMGPEQFAELEERLGSLQIAVNSNRYYEAAQADLSFHRYIWECSGNDTLRQTLDLLTVPLFAFISILRSQGLQKLPAVVEAHEPLIAALRSRDSEQIRKAFEKGATSSYREFMGEASPAAISAFGFLQREEAASGSDSR